MFKTELKHMCLSKLELTDDYKCTNVEVKQDGRGGVSFVSRDSVLVYIDVLNPDQSLTQQFPLGQN